MFPRIPVHGLLLLLLSIVSIRSPEWNRRIRSVQVFIVRHCNRCGGGMGQLQSFLGRSFRFLSPCTIVITALMMRRGISDKDIALELVWEVSEMLTE